jgi:hypothetical protein
LTKTTKTVGKPGKQPFTEEGAKASGLEPPGPRTAQALKAARERQASRPIRPAVKQELVGTALHHGPPHSDVEGWSDHLTDTFGTTSRAFAEQSMLRLVNLTKDPKAATTTEAETNAALALMAAINPANEYETVIAEQIVATHVASMDFLRRSRLNAAEYVDAASAYANMANKTSRTMAVHVEALNKLRTGGKQQVEVRYVYVNGPAVIGDNANAVFGDVRAPKGGGEDAKPPQPHELAALSFAPGAPVSPVRSEEPSGRTVSGAGDAEQEAMPPPRRPRDRGSEG